MGRRYPLYISTLVTFVTISSSHNHIGFVKKNSIIKQEHEITGVQLVCLIIFDFLKLQEFNI